MAGPLPAEIFFDAATGRVEPATGHYVKRLSDLAGMFRDEEARQRDVAERGDPLVYEVAEYRQERCDLFLGTTTMQPGNVGGEYYMTRGHFHARRDRGEVYTTLSGAGLLLLENREGRIEVVEMRTGSVALIPPDWAHRSINTGAVPLVFSWVCPVDAGHDYGPILEKGLRKIVVERAGTPQILDNPAFGQTPA